MHKLENYVTGHWIAGVSDGIPLIDAITGAVITHADTEGLDYGNILEYGRTTGGAALRKMTFQERGNMLKKLALHLTKKKDQFYELSYRTGATKTDSWIDIEGGFGNLFANASLRKLFPNQSFHVEGNAIDLSRGGNFMAHHIMVPKEGIAIHINAFNFPVWGMLEKCAVNWMAGVPAVVKPATSTSYLTEAVVREIIASEILPEGALQLVCGPARNLLNTVDAQDVVTFTGSAVTGRMLKTHPQLIENAVPFNMEADSLNCAVLGEDATPGTPEFDLFIKEVRKEMTVKCGQKCTAIRRIIVPENMIEDVQIALGKALSKVTIGDPRLLKEVRMGALVNKDQVVEVKAKIQEIAKTAQLVYGDLDAVTTIGADHTKGAFMNPILLREEQPFKNIAVHETEAFGPVSTLMPYKDIDEAITLSKMGKGSLCTSIITHDDHLAKTYVLGAASHHGRILILNSTNAKQSTGHGSPLPTLVHGGPGRAGGGEEMGGMRGIKHYLQRCAIQGTPTTLTEITGVYQAGAQYKTTTAHPFAYHWEDIHAGMSIKTHKRTITDTDIINFGNLTWDHFYAHTDITSLQNTIFEKRVAHGYFILSAAAGLFVYPNKGPVAANYGLEDCRFIKPIYHNDTIWVRLTCKEKVDSDTRGKQFPSGIVKWYVEVFDKEDELAAIATILTMVQKKSPFKEISKQYIIKTVDKLHEDASPKWGVMTPQHMLEHLEKSLKMAVGTIAVKEIITPEEHIEKVQESLYSYKAMPKGYQHPLMKKGTTETLEHPNLEEAKKAFIAAYETYETFFDEHPEAIIRHPVFGDLNNDMWILVNRKHFHHHFEQFALL